jgi:hypothetical protein
VTSLDDELRRRLRVLNMMAGAHSTLRDKFRGRGVILDLSILGSSIVLLLTALLDPAILTKLSLDPDEARVVLAILSGIVVFLSIVQLRVDWKERSGRHERAAAMLIIAKAECRLRRKKWEEKTVAAEDVTRWMENVDHDLVSLPPIPENEFVKLKAAHRRKVELSKLLDAYPAASVFWLKLMLWRRDLSAPLATKSGRTREHE